MKKFLLILFVALTACSKNEEQVPTPVEQAPIVVSNLTVKEFLHDIDTAKTVHKECVSLGESRKNIPKCINADRAVYLKFARGDLEKCYKQKDVNHACIDAYLEKHKQ